jgi:hypothetical protein
MMLRHYIKVVLVVGTAAILYLALATYLVGVGFGIAPGLEFLEATLGRVGGSRVWAHTVHALALFISGVPSAVILSFAMHPRAVTFAAVTGVITAIVAVANTILRPDLLALLEPWDYFSVGIDSLKAVLILMLLTWLLSKLPSNYAMQRSSRTGTPLARTGGAEETLRSASGAPVARRR